MRSPLGAGGMGEAYRARDTRLGLGRDVAIKVLPASFSADRDRLERFAQEARAALHSIIPTVLRFSILETNLACSMWSPSCWKAKPCANG